MVLPESFVTAALLLVLSIICFGLWPHIFKRYADAWQFEFFSMDLGVGAILLSVIAAYTFGSRGSDLGFGDSMLVAGQRAEAVAFLAGVAFAFGAMCYLAASALIGLANAGLLAASVFGAVVACFYLEKQFYVTSIVAFAVWILAAVLAVVAASSAKPAKPVKSVPRPTGLRKSAAPRRQLSAGIKGAIVGALGGLSFGGVFPLISMAQPEQLGIGAYGGVLLASIGLSLASIGLNFFFLNISLEDKKAGYGAYFAATWKKHIPGIIAGAVCALGALFLFTAYTGTAGVTRWQAWASPLGGGLLAAATGLRFVSNARQTTLAGVAAFVLGTAVFLFGFR